MDPFDPLIESTKDVNWQPLLTLGIFAAVGSFFLGSLYTLVLGCLDMRNKAEEDNFYLGLFWILFR